MIPRRYQSVKGYAGQFRPNPEAIVTARPRDADELDAALSLEPGRLSSALERSRQLAREGALRGDEDGALGAGSPAAPLPPVVLTRRQSAYCLARAGGLARYQAAASVGVPLRTLRYWYTKPPLRAALNARIDQLQAEHAEELRREARNAAGLAFARLRHIARRGSETEARKAALDILRLAGVDTPDQRGHHAGGPRILIQRAVLALTDAPGTDEATPADRG
jgi:hypothetical protein